jgi:hypothetical protein
MATKRVKALEPVVISCPFGSCDPVTDVSRFTRFAVPEGYEQPSVTPFTNADRNPPKTTNRMAFQQRSAQGVAKSMASAEAQMQESQTMKVCPHTYKEATKQLRGHCCCALCLPSSLQNTGICSW